MDNGKEIKPWWFFVIAALILFLHVFGDRLENQNLILIPVVLLFVVAFGILLRQSIRLWKQRDEEIVSEYLPAAAFLCGSDGTDLKTHGQRFASTALFCAFVLYRTRGRSKISYLFCGVALILLAIPLIRAWLGKTRKQPEGPDYRAASVVAIAVGLIPCAFFCAFMGIGTYHGVWWFVCPPGLIFLSLFSRPLVAGLRILFRKEKDPGEKHVRKHKDIDPWDRPDRKL